MIIAVRTVVTLSRGSHSVEAFVTKIKIFDQQKVLDRLIVLFKSLDFLLHQRSDCSRTLILDLLIFTV